MQEGATDGQGWCRWLRPRLHLEIEKASRVCASPINAAMYNGITGIVSSCTDDGRVIFARLESLESGNSNNLSSVQLVDGSLRCFIWASNHEFLATGAGTSLVLFNILNLRRTVIGDCHSTIHVLKQRSGTVYVGTQGGKVELYDARASFGLVGSAAHVFRRAPHPVQDIGIAGDLVYSATARKGRLWLWDRRDLSKKLRILETGRYLCSVHVPESDTAPAHPPYLLCDRAVLRTDAGISICETIGIDAGERTLPGSVLQYSAPHGLFLWNVRDGVCIWDGRDSATLEHPGMSGLEAAGPGKYILYTKDGLLSVATMTRQFRGQ